jgi:hypothetical protein
MASNEPEDPAPAPRGKKPAPIEDEL